MSAEVDPRGRPAPAADASGATVGEAKWVAMKELERRFPGLQVEHVEFEELGGDRAEDEGVRVRATADVDAWRAAKERFEWPEEPGVRVRVLLRRVCAHLDLRASVDVEETDEEVRAQVSGAELGLLIGKHGSTIDALQYLCSQVAYRGSAERKRVVVDAGGYRERREGAVLRQADRAAEDALRYGRPVELDSMSAVERRIVHLHLQERPDVDTHSEGDEPYRRVVVSPLRRRD